MIFETLPDINSQIIRDLISEHEGYDLPRYRKQLEYYKGKHNILNRPSEGSEPNNKLVNDYPGYIVDTAQGYFIGIPVKYSHKNDAFKKDLDDVLDENNEEDHNAELAKYMGIHGKSYELLYLNGEGKIRFFRLPNEETIIVYDGSMQRSIQMALRYYIIQDANTKKDIRKVEIYHTDRVDYYTQEGENYKLDKSLPHYFGKVPVIYYENNDEGLGDFDKIVTLIDDYDKRESDNSNELEAFRFAYLKIKNMSNTSDDDIARAKKIKAFFVDGDGDVSFVEKNINDGFSEHHLERLDKNIHKFSKIPNLSDEAFGGNLSGVAIKFKLWPIEQLAIAKERKFKTALKRRIRLICEIFRIKAKNYNWKDVGFTFKRNMPSNLLELAQMIPNMAGTLSNRTIISQMPFVEDPDEEIRQLKEEQNDPDSYSDFFKKSALKQGERHEEEKE